MQVLVCGATKGGVGKTTLAAALGVEATRTGWKTVLIDADPQRSLVRWGGDRKEEPPVVVEADKYIDRTLAEARGEGFDIAIIDTPPGNVTHTEPAVEVADLVLVPVRASPIDVDSLDVIMDMVAKYEKDYLFVLNAITPRSKLAEGARQYLAQVGDVLGIEIANRLIYASAMMGGRTAAEIDAKGAAAAEIATLWKEIEKRLKRVSKKKPIRAMGG
jgi:chromosome partitioning protein